MNYRLMSLFLVVGMFGCVTIDSAQVRAKPGVPEAARVETLAIPLDSSLPRYALVVNAFVMEGPSSQTRIETRQPGNGEGSQNGIDTSHHIFNQGALWDRGQTGVLIDSRVESPREVSGGARSGGVPDNRAVTDITSRTWSPTRPDVNVAAQFTSSLAGVSNFMLLNPAAVRPVSGGRYEAALPPGVVGPFVVKAILTEEVYEVEGGRSRLFVPGLIATSSSELMGVAVLDVTVTDGRSGALVSAFPTEATFTSQEKRFSGGIILPVADQMRFARSVSSRAQRVALNEATKKIFQALRKYR